MRNTIDFGIDLGTTNSVIAVADGGKVEVIKNNGHQITPSAVYIDKKGKVYRGHPASHHANNVKKSSDVHTEFKREMGQSVSRQFQAAGRSMSPEELSGEILAELRRAAGDRFGHQPDAAVITVPAMFELPQNDATARAAKLAGFQASLLLQEPVAAATAYGFDSNADKAHWLVYDLGGGTFDASIVSVRDGQLSVTRHAGDNYLGGADFDRDVVDQVIVPHLRDEYDLGSLSRDRIQNDPLARARYSLLKVIAEELKKTLSRTDTDTVFFEEVFEDDAGTPVDIECELSRDNFERIISPHVQKSLDITVRLIADSGLNAKDVERILLVGGSTYVPYVQQQVATLGIAVDRTQDPMTVVAHGAAVFASSQRMPKSISVAAPSPAGAARVELEYEPVGKDLAPMVGGKLLIDNAAPPVGYTLTLNRITDEGWTSGELKLDGKGLFFTRVQLRDSGQSVFQVVVRDPKGNSMPCAPDTFAITYGMSVAKASLPQAVSVGLADGSAQVLIESGASLPCSSEVFRSKTVKSVARGSSDSIQIPFMTGDHPESELNRVGICWTLHGSDLMRDIPKGTDIELAVQVDVDGTTTASITVPILDEQFAVRQSSELEHEPPSVMLERLGRLRARLTQLEADISSGGSPDAAEELATLKGSKLWDQVTGKIAMWEHGDPVAAGQARNLLVDLSKQIKASEGLAHWPAKLAEYEEVKSQARRNVHDHGGINEKQALEQLVAEAENAVSGKDPRMLDKTLTRLHQLNYSVLRQDPRFLAGMLHHLAEREGEYLDRRRGQDLLREGSLALRRQDTASLQSIVSELLRLLPPDVSETVGPAVRADIL